MFFILTTVLYTIQIFSQCCKCLNVIDLPQDSKIYGAKDSVEIRQSEMYDSNPDPAVKSSNKINRRYWLLNDNPAEKGYLKSSNSYGDEKDSNLKSKISGLIKQTMHSTEKRMKNVEHIKQKYRGEAPYRVGFVLSLVKKSRDVLNELFNVAVKHRDEWKAVEQLKIYELIMHTNVDTTNLLRQLIEIHLNNLNVTVYRNETDEKKVIIL